MFARPLAVVGLIRIVLLPAFSDALSVLVAQTSHDAVGSNAPPAWTVEPLTMMSAGRPAVVPLEYRIAIDAVPAAPALTVNCEAAPTALLALQKPVPEKPVWLASMRPSHVAGAFSASSRTGAAYAVAAATTPA